MVKEKVHICIVVIGHVDSGKSTTTGHLVLLCGGIDKRTIEKFEKEATAKGKGSFKFAWVLDSGVSERERGITINSKQTKIETPNKVISVTDAPGHRDFLKNLITGASSADYCILVVPAKQGEFETAIGPGGQIKEQCQLVKTMGSKCICVLVNKMDCENYSEARFTEIKKAILSLLSKVGFPQKSVAVIPISGFVGDNLIEVSDKMPWYKGFSYITKNFVKNEDVTINGVTYFDYLDSLPETNRLTDSDLRIPLNEIYKVSGVGTVATGRVETGVIKPNDVVYICPANISAEAKSIEMHHTALEKGSAGDSIGINLKNVAVNEIKRGNILGHLNKNPPRVTESFLAQIFCINEIGKNKGFRVGYAPVMDIHTYHGPVKIAEIRSRIDRRSGQAIVEDNPDAPIVVKNQESAMIVLQPVNPVCVECFSDFPPLGRFAIRDSKMTVAVGVIKEVTKKEVEVKKGGATKAAQPKKKK